MDKKEQEIKKLKEENLKLKNEFVKLQRILNCMTESVWM